LVVGIATKLQNQMKTETKVIKFEIASWTDHTITMVCSNKNKGTRTYYVYSAEFPVIQKTTDLSRWSGMKALNYIKKYGTLIETR
tara:strand:- start:13312 stop:13566 length:255 start_codon:yes stop_codon:yes gene_type:complete